MKRLKPIHVFIGIGTVLVAFGGTGLLFWNVAYPFFKPVRYSAKQEVAQKSNATKAATAISPLTGVAVEASLVKRPLTAAIIANHPESRPQSGLASAGVVYEALTEGGVTRFMALYLENHAPVIGPIRSLRPYFVDWALEFNAPVAHAGGSADALDMISSTGLKTLNQFAYGQYFWRATDRYAPHNLYTSSDKLAELEKLMGYDRPTDVKATPRKADSPVPKSKASQIRISYSSAAYQVDYRYDPATNDYARFLGNLPHIDRNTGAQIRTKNIVVQYMPTSTGTTRIGEPSTIMGTPGSGQALIFCDGTVTSASWKKTSHTERTKLVDAKGAEIALNAGNTWYAIVPAGRTVTYK